MKKEQTMSACHQGQVATYSCGWNRVTPFTARKDVGMGTFTLGWLEDQNALPSQLKETIVMLCLPHSPQIQLKDIIIYLKDGPTLS